MLLVIVGKSNGRTQSRCHGELGRLPRGDYHWFSAPGTQDPARWLVEHRLIPRTTFWPTSPGHRPLSRLLVVRVATALLSSQLNYVIRTQRSLSYAAYAPFIDQALPLARVCKHRSPDQVLRSCKTPCVPCRLRIEYFELSRFLDSYTFDYLEQNATPRTADFLARAELYLGDFRRGDEFMKRMRGVSSNDVMTAANLGDHLPLGVAGSSGRHDQRRTTTRWPGSV